MHNPPQSPLPWQPRDMPARLGAARLGTATAALIGQRIVEGLRLLDDALSPARRLVHEGDVLYRSGETFEHLHVLNSGCFKLLSVSESGYEQVVGLKFRGDWLGFGGIAQGSHACDAIAMDTAEVWSIRYDALLRACGEQPRLLAFMHEAMSSEIMRDRETKTALCTLAADARVAAFLHDWADSLAVRGLRTDQISLRLSRAEIGNYLGLTLETVSRVLSRLAKCRLIAFHEKSRRDICIPDYQALGAFTGRRSLSVDLH
jgi:CRP/FNR family transcriptional regulator, anaerobic regulatory protein